MLRVIHLLVVVFFYNITWKIWYDSNNILVASSKIQKINLNSRIQFMQLQFLICFENDNFPILQFAIAINYYCT